MPKRGEHTPISDDDAMEMAIRFSRWEPQALDFEKARDWADYVRRVLHYEPSIEQLMRSWEGRILWQREKTRLGFELARQFVRPGIYRLGFRDIATGRFISRTVAAERARNLGFKALAKLFERPLPWG